MSYTEIVVSSVYDFPDVRINLSQPEDVLIFVEDDGVISVAEIFSDDKSVMGAASYDDAYGAGLDYTLKELLGSIDRVGWMVVEGITATYIKGDMYTTDDDMRFHYRTLRDATSAEKQLGLDLERLS